jgi:hypothetical protein
MADMTIEEKIETALFTAVAALTLDGSPPIAWPNSVAAVGKTHVRIDHLRNRNSRFLVKGTAPHLRQGILLLTVVAPLNEGPTPALALAGSIAEQFPADLAMVEDDVKVRVQAAPDVATPIRQDASYDVVVSVRYECFA